MISDIYELAPIQAGMLVHRLRSPESTAYFSQFACELNGSLDTARLRAAWHQLLDRHDVLRTSFHWEGLEAPVQVVHRQATLPWAEHDWRGLPAADHAARWDQLLAADRADGFDPAVAPLMRCIVARVSDDRAYFCWSHHHLLLDGWCLTLVLTEVFARYEALRTLRAPQLPPVRRYREYIDWLQQRDSNAARAYWRGRLAGVEAATPLPECEVPAPEGEGGHRTLERWLSEEDSARLREAAARGRLTLSTIAQGAWALLLHRYSGEREVIFGTTVSGRPADLPGVESMLGVFINTVPLRAAIDPDATAAAWLAGLQAASADRDAFAWLPLADIQKCSDIAPGMPLFASNLIVMNYRLDDDAVHGRDGLGVGAVRTFDHADTPLTLQVTPGARVLLELAYDAARFDAATMTRLLAQVEQLLGVLADDLERPLRAFEIVTPAERHELLHVFNATDAPLDPARTIVDAWETRVAQTPDAIALRYGQVALSFAELNARANRLARALLQQVDLGADQLVALAFNRSDWMAAAMLATWKCGAAYVPIDPAYPDERIRLILDDARPSVVLRDPGTLRDALDPAAASHALVTSIAELAAASAHESAENLGRAIDSGQLAYVIFTSGSTGRPKGAMIEHLGLMNHVLAKVEAFDLGPGSVVVQSASHCFDISVWQFVAALIGGGTVAIYADDVVLDPDRFLACLEDDRATVVEAVPSYLSVLLDRLDEHPRRLADLRYLLVTGEMIKPALVERWLAKCPHVPAVNAYGPTEAADDVTQAVLTDAPRGPNVPVGRPLRNFHIYIVDEHLNLCPVGVKGEICVSGAGVGRGYINDPAKTAAAFLEDPFRAERGVRMYRTGDIGFFRADGSVVMLGRRDTQVKVRGYRVELGDIEAALAAVEGVAEAAVVERHDRADGSYLAAYVTVRDGAAIDAASLLDRLSASLPDYMVPASCNVLPAMPLTPNGKIDRKALPAPAAVVRATSAYAPPRSDAERALAAIWRDLLGVEQPGIHDNFFALGGDSIVSMQLVSRAARAGLSLTPRDVFERPTIAELAATGPLHDVSMPFGAGHVPAGPSPLTPVQAQFFEDVSIDRHHYNQSVLIEVGDDFDWPRCQRALAVLVQHHDALRLRFTDVGGEWRQQVATTGQLVAFSVHDVGADDASLTQEADRVQASLHLVDGPLVHAALFTGGHRRPASLLIVVHHLAIDGVSWRILLDDLQDVYGQLGRREEPSLPPGVPYLAWAEMLAGSAAEMAGDAPFWTAEERRGAADLLLDTPEHPSAITVGEVIEAEIVFDEETTAALLTRAPRALGVGATELLLGAVGQSLASALGCQRLLVDLETHGRDHDFPGIDLSRAVGWFTSTYPVLVTAAPAGDQIERVVARLAAQLRAVPHRGLSYGLLRQAAAAGAGSGADALPRAAVLFNFHGRTDAPDRATWRVSLAPQGAPRSLRQHREYVLEVNCLVAGNRLRVALGYSPRLHRPATIDAFERHLRDAIGTLASAMRRHTWLASEVGSALSQRSFDALMATQQDAVDVYGLSPTQQGMLFHALYDPSSSAYFNQLTCVVRGDLDVARFQQAWTRTIERHPVLRTSFHWKDLEQPVQVVHEAAQPEWMIEDWQATAAGEQDLRWTRSLAADRRRGFVLSSAPLMRFTLCRIAADAWRFCWSQHHLLFDGWSASIVLEDVLRVYDGTVAQAAAPPVPRPFRDAVTWLAAQDANAAEQFWREELAGFTAPTPLVLGEPEMCGTRGVESFARAQATIPAGTSAALRALCAAEQITVNTLFQGLWAILLSRYSGEREVVFGGIVSGRPPALEGADGMVGLFINTIPVRAHIDDEARVAGWLRERQREHARREAFSYGSLADVQRWSGVEGGAPLFETIVIFEHYPVAAALQQGTPAFAVEAVQAIEPNNYPLTFVVTPGDQIALTVMYDAGRFDRDTAKRILAHLQVLLDGVLADPGRPLGTLPLLTGTDQQMLASWNDTDTPLPERGTVVELIEAGAAARPDAVAVSCEGRTVSYGSLNARANQLARVIAAETAGDTTPRVAVLLRRSERLLEAVLAIWKAGAIYVPVDPDYPAERISMLVERSRAALVVTDRWLEDVDAARQAQEAGDLGRPPSPRDVAYVIFTSGSTGVPKGAMVEHAGMLNHMLSMVAELGLGPGSVVAQTASHCFDISMWQLFAALLAGGTTTIYPETLVMRPLALARRMEQDVVSVAQFVPSYLNVFLDALERERARPPFGALTHMVTIGEALPYASVERWFRLFPGVPLMNAYGPTEAADSVAHVDMASPPEGHVVPIGRPIRNMRLYVLDSAMRPCPPGVKGQICIAGVGVGRGYLFDEDRTRDAFVSDPVHAAGGRMYCTGDIGCFRADGTLLFFGRRDFQVKVRGHRIELGEIESALAAHPSIRLGAVVVRRTAGGDAFLCAYVTARAGSHLDATEVTAYLAERLPRHAVPDVIRVIDEMPVLPNGKIDRQALSRHEVERSVPAATTAPVTPTERRLLAIWREVLQREDIGVEDRFFEVGGHSLKAIDMAGRIGRDLGVEVAIADLFEHDTIRALSRVLDGDAAAPASIPHLPDAADYATSSTQQRLWLASRTLEGSVALNMSGAFHVEGVLDVEALGRALRLLAARHESLRTVFILSAGTLRQRVLAPDAYPDLVHLHDHRHAAEATVREIVRRLVEQPFDLERGPLVAVDVLRTGDAQWVLLVRMHHIIGDAASIRVLLEEAAVLYAARASDTSMLPPLAVQYRDFAAWEETSGDAAGTHRQYWRTMLGQPLPRSGFASDRQTDDAPPGADVFDCEIDAAETARLRALAGRHGTTLFGVSVAAVLALLYRHCAQQDLVVGTQVSRRLRPELERQIGSYIDTLVLRSAVRPDDTAGALLARTAHAVRDALAHQEYPFARLLEDLALPVLPGQSPLFDVLVNFVPASARPTAIALDAGVAIADLTLDLEAAQYDTAFLLTESDDGSCFGVRIVFDGRKFSAGTAAAVGARLRRVLAWFDADGADTVEAINLVHTTTARRRLHIALKTE